MKALLLWGIQVSAFYSSIIRAYAILLKRLCDVLYDLAQVRWSNDLIVLITRIIWPLLDQKKTVVLQQMMKVQSDLVATITGHCSWRSYSKMSCPLYVPASYPFLANSSFNSAKHSLLIYFLLFKFSFYILNSYLHRLFLFCFSTISQVTQQIKAADSLS